MTNRIDQSIRKELVAEHLTTPRLLPLKKAADLLGLTVWALRERIWAGHIPVVQFPGGRKQYVDVRDLEGFIDSHKRVVE
jgi:predicted site-specific integrase-resolvase